MVAALQGDGYVFQIDEPARVREIENSIFVRKYFTEGASIPDLHPPRVGLYLVGLSRDKADMLAIGVSTGTTQTGSARIKIKKIVRFDQSSLADIIPDDDFGKKLRRTIIKQNKLPVGSGTFNSMLRNIERIFPEIVPRIDKLVKIANGIDFDADAQKATLFAQQQDALRSAFAGFSLRRPGYEDEWEPDEYDESLTYLDGFQDHNSAEHVTEDDIAIHDHAYFPGFVNDDKYHLKTNAFTDGQNTILVTMANRNAIEDVLGIDLIYYNEFSEAFCLVQYKRMNKKGGRYTYYTSSDGNYEKDIRLMTAHTATFESIEKAYIGNDLNICYDSYRLFGSPFFFKFSGSSQFYPFHNKVIPGHYLSFDMWQALARESEQKGITLKASAETLTKFISPNEFCELLKRGMIGSRRCSADAVVQVLAECLRGNRSVVFAHKPALINQDDKSEVFDITSK